MKVVFVASTAVKSSHHVFIVDGAGKTVKACDYLIIFKYYKLKFHIFAPFSKAAL